MRQNWIAAGVAVLITTPVQALEQHLSGLVDVRYSYSDTIDSYTGGGMGKFSNDDGSNLSLAQAGLDYQVEFNDQWSFRTVANATADGVQDGIGLTEYFFRYRGLPSDAGYRHQFRIGTFYPVISMENIATAWSTPYTLNPSMMNTWIGEELRTTGIEYRGERLGKFVGSTLDLRWNATLFVDNDPAGAMLSWHGWTMSSRQTLLHERLPLPDFPARNADLAAQAAESDPFLELDDKLGYMLSTELRWDRKARLQLGFFDNNAIPFRVENGQYGWHTQFAFAGASWRFNPNWEVIAQAMNGSTLMQNHYQQDVVNNDYKTAYLMLNWRQKKHRSAIRVEGFNVTDKDTTWGDNNNETGRALTLSYRYALKKNLFLHSEYSWIESKRPARTYNNQSLKLIERQLQFGLRYYFR